MSKYDPKPCNFCPNDAVYAPLDLLEKHGVGVFFCHICQAEYLYFFDGICASVSLYTTINDKMYRYTTTSVGTASLNYIINPGIPGLKKNGNVIQIKYFDPKQGHAIQHLTPQNVCEKLKTWLIFL